VLAASLGWTQFFILTTLAALPAMAIMLFLLWRLPPVEAQHQRPVTPADPG
jgi:PAT family beta-lactamase induction signal transducer AmpG